MKSKLKILAAALLISLLTGTVSAQDYDPMEEWLEMGDMVRQITESQPSPVDERQYSSPCPFPLQDLKTIAVNPSGKEYIRRLRLYFPDATFRMTGLSQLKEFVNAHSGTAKVYITSDKPVFRDDNKEKIILPQVVVEFEYPDTFKSYFRNPLFVKNPDLGNVKYILVTPIGPFFAKTYGKNSVNFYFFSPKF